MRVGPDKHYDRVTDSWSRLLGDDLHYGYFSDPQMELQGATAALTRQLSRAAMLKDGAEVLDVGCGTGKPACDIARESGCRVTGISPSRVCIERATARARGAGLTARVRFLLGDGMALAFRDAGFDCVWVMESSHLIPDKAALLAECHRVLRPGGRLVLCDIMARRVLDLAAVIEFRDQFLLLQAAFGRAWMEPMASYREKLEGLGFTVTRAEDISAATRMTFAHWRHNAMARRAEVVQLLGEKSWREFLDSCTVLEQMWDRAVLGYGVIAASKASAAKTENRGTHSPRSG